MAINAKKVTQKMYPDIEKPSEKQIQIAKEKGVDLIVGYQTNFLLFPMLSNDSDNTLIDKDYR